MKHLTIKDTEKHITFQDRRNGIVHFAHIKIIKNYATQLVNPFNLHICIDEYNKLSKSWK